MAMLKFYEKLPSIQQIKQLLIDEALKRTNGNQVLAAQILGISRKGLRVHLQKRFLAKNILSIFLVLLLFTISHADEMNNYVKGQVVVKFQADTSLNEIDELIGTYGLSVREKIPQINYYIFDYPETLTISEIVTALSGHDIVVECEPNYIAKSQDAPNDSYFSSQWGLYNRFREDVDIHILEAWEVENGDPDIVVAIIDMGFDVTHEDLKGNIWQNPGEIPDNGVDDDRNGYIDDTIGWDFVDQSQGFDDPDSDWRYPDNDPSSKLSSHGNLVLGILGATTDNSLGIAGVAGRCKMMLIRAGYFNTEGEASLSSAYICKGLIYAADNGARVINISSGSTQQSTSYADALAYAINKGALIVTSVGNEGDDTPVYPAAYDMPGIISVGASTTLDRKASFSNYGDWVDVSAPGVSIVSTILNNGYKTTQGTSFAAPMVAGVAALLFSRYPDWVPSQAQDRIMNTVDISEDLAEANITSGRLNAYRALTDGSGDSQTVNGPIINASADSDSGSGGMGCFISSIPNHSQPPWFYLIIAGLIALGLAVIFEKKI